MTSERLNAALADRYTIERELGQGGMATVYLAEDLKHKRKVAVKVLKPELAAVLGADRFVQEITTTAALQHPHILPLFDSGTADGFLYYVMPFIQGETLRAKLDRETQLGIDEAVRIARDVADALDYAHRHGVIHRDIKPENILLHDGRPMVADFGIALAVSAAAGGRMTETGLSLGTPHYMSPEQATAEKEITARSDVYSLGSVLYEMLTGNPPHTGASAQQIIMKIVTEEAAPVTKLRRAVPPNVASAVAKSLEKLPADRFASAKEFGDALANPSFTEVHRGAVPGAYARARRINRVLAVLVAALLVGLGWQASRPVTHDGPRAYDVALPDTAPVNPRSNSNFSVAPNGDFVIYVGGEHRELWYRSLLDATVRRIDATGEADRPTISPDGKQVAFVRNGSDENTIEVSSVDGGAPALIARSRATTDLVWLPSGQILLTEGDGLHARTLDPRGGPSTNVAIQYCINPSPLPDRSKLLCGGGGDKQARWSSLSDSSSSGFFRRSGPDSGFVFGADFRLIDGKYLVWVSTMGDLVAAAIDVAAQRVGRPVRLVTSLARRAYTGAGSYAISASGTLVYANGVNEAVGNLVWADGRTLDTLPVGRESFLQSAMSPNGRRLAVVVELQDGQELRLYDLETGGHTVWLKRPTLRQPVWGARGDRLIVSTSVDTLFEGPPDATSAPQVALTSKLNIEGFSSQPDGRLIATAWDAQLVIAVHLDRRPLSFDTLATSAVMGRLSPDARWLAYNAPDFGSAWVEPFPRTGQRYPAGPGDYPQWVSPSEFVISTDAGHFERVKIDATVQPPRITRQPWFDVPRFVSIASGGFGLTPDGKVIYKEGAPAAPIRYLHVIPNWVAQMKRAVAEANK
jgi:tRNA A-37 threonylcarbamoyl transferase component Bud32